MDIDNSIGLMLYNKKTQLLITNWWGMINTTCNQTKASQYNSPTHYQLVHRLLF